MKIKFFAKRIYGIEVVASSQEKIKKIQKALRFFKTKEEKLFKNFQFLKAILVYPGKTYNNLLIVNKKVYVCQTKTILESSKEYLASLFIHETKHILQYKNKQRYYGKKAEIEAYKLQRKFLEKYGHQNEVEWLDKQLKEKWWIKQEKESKGTFYSPSYKNFIKFADLYLEKKLKIEAVDGNRVC